MYDKSFIEGNLRERSLYEIWNDKDAFSYNRKFTVEQPVLCKIGFSQYCFGVPGIFE